LNTTYPSSSQFMHDSFWTTTASVCGTAIEVALCHIYATSGEYPKTLAENQIVHIFLALLITHWRIPHFYFIHRGMHPWRTTSLPDVGKFLYRNVHYLHHKSYNPTAFSGTSMHPVESTLYYSAAFMTLPFFVHITIPLACIIDCAVGAWLGHDGF
jgi:sterol desaturase/sphingolipid hydroxylase (fatty acid hydroxylase superfamily)